jgi:molecular chaperone HtpG
MSEINKKEFEANIDELINLIVNSFYSNRDVCLRELVSNASDANDKQRLTDLKNGKVNKEYRIRIDPLTLDGCLVIEDTGIGMSYDDLVQSLSTIASSGTKKFARSLSEKSDLIGQFGVGFYSAFLVADKVEIFTKKENDRGWLWTSDASKYYTVGETSALDGIDHGTRIVLHLKEDASEYRDEKNIRRIIGHHSSFITYPIELYTEKEVEAPTTEEPAAVEEAEEEPTVEEEEEAEEEPTVKESEEPSVEEPEPAPVVKEKTRAWETINGSKPVWYRSPEENTKEDYEELYKTISNDWEKPLYWKHFRTEGAFEFRGIIFVPSKTPYDALGDRSRDKRNIKLYSKKVLVLQELDKDMLPDWMNFAVGVIDSPDLPLNVSREMLQQTRVVKALKTQLRKQVMNTVEEIYADAELFPKFYDSFHRHLKLGIHEGDDSLLSYLRMKNSRDDKTISFDEYLEGYRTGDDQKAIYYATGQDNVFAGLYREKGYTVLYFTEPIDEFMLQRVHKYKEHELVNVSKDHTVPWARETNEEEKEAFKEFGEWFKETTGDSNIEAVRISDRLVSETDDPICVVSSKWGWTGNMEKIMAAQPLGDNKSMAFMKGRKIIEINTVHPIIRSLRESYKTGDRAKKDAGILYRCALLTAGFPIEDMSGFARDVVSNLGATATTV